MSELKPALNVEQVATILKVQPMSVYEAVKHGVIPHFRVGKHIRFSQDAIAEWIKSGGTSKAMSGMYHLILDEPPHEKEAL
jgi:excisionase family DNA binding protein